MLTNQNCLIYELDLAHEKFDIYNEVAPQSKFLSWQLEIKSWVDAVKIYVSLYINSNLSLFT